MTDQGQVPLPLELVATIRKEAVTQVAKWTLGAVVLLFGISLTGWWFYLKEKIDTYIVLKAGGIPASAIVAFDRPANCPKGWSIFEPTISRVILGASADGKSPNRDQNGLELTARQYRMAAGEERHTLSISEMPAHDHGIEIVQHGEYLRENKGYLGTESVGRDVGRADPRWALRYTEKEGGGMAHNVMPPFVALFYCEKKDE